MKCIHCNTDSNYKDRQANDGRCKQCRHPFAFDPRSNPEHKLSDGLFARAILEISEKGTLSFTETQLYYEICRRLDRKLAWSLNATGGMLAGFGGFGGVVASMVLGTFWPVVLVSVPAVAAGVVVSRLQRKKAARTPPLELHGFHSTYMGRWEEVNGSPEQLVRAPAPAAPAAPADPATIPGEPDLTAYSFDRALVTQSADVAAALVANNFHFENNCAILSLDGYPFDRRDTILAMLRRNPSLKVFALHDASARGCGMLHDLRAPGWFPEPATQIVDLGLRPAHVLKSRMYIHQAGIGGISPQLRDLLEPGEVEWLDSGKVASVQQFRPARLMRSIYQGFARANQMGADGSVGDSSVSDPGFIWIHTPSADVYATDSFG